MKEIKKWLDEKLHLYHQADFILKDPVSIPHRFTQIQDIEIAGFFAATIAWGNRTTILNNALRLLQLMDHAPYSFIRQHQDSDLKRFLGFAHRTFNATDLLYFIQFLQHHYSHHDSLETAFVPDTNNSDEHVGNALQYFHQYFFSLEHPQRTRKHIATPAKNAACKRLNMYLRWMVRKDEQGIDFGLWNRLHSHQLIIPLDVHVARVSCRIGLLEYETSNWKNAVILTNKLKQMDADDPVKYDYALFGMGVLEG